MQKVVTLERRPVGLPEPGVDLVVGTAKRPTADDLKDGEVLVKNLFLSLDPAMRGWMRDVRSYMPPVKVGEVMRGSSIGQIIASKDDSLQPGDFVNCMIEIGWQEFGIVKARKVRKVKEIPGFRPTVHLSALGGTGLTAYFGLIDVGKPQPGETVVVSAAAGATGSMVCQIAKHVVGCRVVGIAGGPAKCKWLKDELGVDEAIDYKANQKGFKKVLRKAAPNGVDIFFDNVGGWILEETLKQINMRARIVLCGAIATYNAEKLAPGPSSYMNLISTSSRMEGFILFNYIDRYEEAYRDIEEWIRADKIKVKEEIVPGLEIAPKALLKLFGKYGGNHGRLIVEVFGDASKAKL